uniref:AlNc14C216G9019 protein n=1 Tax=Albugo laibachii Nc14 TaxID=890382 RepID=F0WRM0_9STRA|nr:AlNc14C216G9019 [Albugo laibachii Nc14]|eukprot:CCA23984.1 AlNc14C216G9019 [Albugo laibachii Nc14]
MKTLYILLGIMGVIGIFSLIRSCLRRCSHKRRGLVDLFGDQNAVIYTLFGGDQVTLTRYDNSFGLFIGLIFSTTTFVCVSPEYSIFMLLWTCISLKSTSASFSQAEIDDIVSLSSSGVKKRARKAIRCEQ